MRGGTWVLMENPSSMDSRSYVVPELSGQTRDEISRQSEQARRTERANGRRGRREQCDPETRTMPPSRSDRSCVRPHGTIGRGGWGNEKADSDQLRAPIAKMAKETMLRDPDLRSYVLLRSGPEQRSRSLQRTSIGPLVPWTPLNLVPRRRWVL